jgi:transketolase
MNKFEVNRLTNIARELRITILSIIYRAQASHIGSAYSIVELLVYLYEKVIRIDPKNPFAPNRDRFILSKGWGVSALYSILSYKKILDHSFLTSYCSDGSLYLGIATKNGLPGIEATTGSMGHGLPLGVGMALSAKLRHLTHRVFVIIGDGELDEGSTWEAILQASHFKLDNLIVIVDCNGWQSYGRTRDVLNLDSIPQKFESFGWKAKEINGHNFLEIHEALQLLPYVKNKPSVIVAKTVKGKGVSIFEDRNEWHYRTPKEKEMHIALEELSGKEIRT